MQDTIDTTTTPVPAQRRIPKWASRPHNTPDGRLTVEGVAARLSYIYPATIRRYAAAGELRGERTADGWAFDWDDVIRFMDDHRVVVA